MADQQYDFSMIGSGDQSPSPVSDTSSPGSSPQGNSATSQYDFSMIGKPEAPVQNIGDQIQKNVDTLKSKTMAALLGYDNGIKTFSTTLKKLTNQAGSALGISQDYLPDVNKAQAEYEHAHQAYETDPDSIAHPAYSIGGNLAAQSLETAPLYMASDGAAGALAGGTRGLASLAAKTLTNTVAGGIQGGLSTVAGQNPDQAFNPQGAKIGMATGAILSPIQGAVGGFQNTTNDIATLQDNLASQGFKSRPMASDMSNGVSQGLSNNILNKIPIIGNTPYRQAQGNALKSDIQQYIGDISQQTLDSTKQKIGNILQNHSDMMDNLENNAWGDFKGAVQDSGVQSVPRNSSQVGIDSLLDNSTGLGTKFKTSLQNLPEDATPEQHLAAQRDMWQAYKPLQNKINMGNATADETDTANTLRNTYFNMKDDLGQAIQGTSAEPAYQTANAMTQANKSLYDPRYQKQLVGAISDMNNNQRGLDNYIDWITNPSTNTRDIQTQMGVLGQEGSQAASQLSMKNMLASSMDYSGSQPVLKLNKFMQQYNQLPNSAQGMLNKDAMDSMEGLQTVAGQFLNSQKGGGANLENSVVKGDLASYGLGGAGIAAATHGLAIPVAIGTGALSFLSRYSPVKQALIGINKVTPGSGLSNYLLDNIQKMMIRNGVSIGVDQQGNVKIDKPDEQTGTKRQLTEAMNSRSPQQPNQQTPLQQLPQDPYGGGLEGLG